MNLRSLMVRREEQDQGFTLIELLVVIIIIGILAAIAIPVFLSQRERAREASIQSDIEIAAKFEEAYFTSNFIYGSVVSCELTPRRRSPRRGSQ